MISATSQVATRSAGAAFHELAAQVAHDLNNHLATMLGKAEIGLMLDDPARWRRSLEEILAAGQPARVELSDLQRLVAWSAAEGEAVLLDEALALVARLSSRRCASAGVQLAVTGDGVRVERTIAAGTAVALWCAVREALENAPAAGNWSIVARRGAGAGWSVRLETPGCLWDAAVRAAAERAVRLGEPAPGRLGAALEALAGIGTSVEFEDEALAIGLA
ncbi:MAG: hypothetical protein KBD01_12070 [Acidobacteria bacterium]|nr:hypothetical protein [Acidobacteriota bacterium]